jgi:hypothetical protein
LGLNGGSLGFDGSDNLFATFTGTTLFKIDTTTGVATQVGPAGGLTYQVMGLAYGPKGPVPTPVPTPLPTGGGGIAEGTYAGSKGPSDVKVEGGFGFGRSNSLLPVPLQSRVVLNGPFSDNRGDHRVINTAFTQGPNGETTDNVVPVVAFALTVGIALALGVLYSTKAKC